jgi:predicted nucleic acid-binding protein
VVRTGTRCLPKHIKIPRSTVSTWRGRGRRTSDLAAMLADFRRRIDRSAIMWVGSEAERLYEDILDFVASTGGKLNFNDAFIAVLQKEGRIGPVATFDAGFDAVPGFLRVPLVARTHG